MSWRRCKRRKNSASDFPASAIPHDVESKIPTRCKPTQLRGAARVGRLPDYRPWRLLRRCRRRSAFSRLEGRIGVALLCPNLDRADGTTPTPTVGFSSTREFIHAARVDASTRIHLCGASSPSRSSVSDPPCNTCRVNIELVPPPKSLI